jgi:HD-like signal output (HDOD) protein
MSEQKKILRLDTGHVHQPPPHFDERISPIVYGKVAAAVQDNGRDLAAIAQMIEQDQYLSEMVLGLINSATFALNHEIHDVSQAVALLGARRLRRFLGARPTVPSN